MEADVECTHCGVVMTSWSAAGSPIRYYQCPFCARTHSSLYGEVFRRGAGARLVDHRSESPAGGIPEASTEDVRWASIKATAARWFARLESDERRVPRPPPPVAPLPRAARAPMPRAVRAPLAPLIDPRHVVELAPAQAGRRKA
jgi:hypothetical protein